MRGERPLDMNDLEKISRAINRDPIFVLSKANEMTNTNDKIAIPSEGFLGVKSDYDRVAHESTGDRGSDEGFY